MEEEEDSTSICKIVVCLLYIDQSTIVKDCIAKSKKMHDGVQSIVMLNCSYCIGFCVCVVSELLNLKVRDQCRVCE